MAASPVLGQTPPDALPPPVNSAGPDKPAPPGDPYSALFRAMFDDVDPVILYFVLIPLTIERVLALRNLFTTIPDAVRAVRELVRYPTNRREMILVKAAIKDLKKRKPELFEKLTSASTAYEERLHQLDVLFKELKEIPAIAKNKHRLAELESLIRSYKEHGDFSVVDSWVARNRKNLLNGGKGSAWAQRLDLWKKKEREEARDVVFRSNEITNALNAGFRENEMHPTLFTSSNNGAFQPGIFYVGGDKQMRSKDINEAANTRCTNLFLALYDKKLALRGKVGATGILNQGYKITSPLLTVGAAGGLVYLHYAAYENTIRRHGKAPDAAKAEVARRSQIENQVNLQAEASLDGQLAKRAAEVTPFSDIIVGVLQKNQDKIFEKVKEYQVANPGTRIDWAKKRDLFMKGNDLAFQVRQALPFAAQMRIGKDLNMDQLLKFLSLPSTDPKIATMQQRFLNTVYSRVLDNVFPELEAVKDLGDNLITVGAGHSIGTPMRNHLVDQTLPLMDKMHLVVPPNVAPHPAIPDPRTEPPSPPPQQPPPIPLSPANDAAVPPVPPPQKTATGGGIPPLVSKIPP